MPEVHFRVRWPDDSRSLCYSPSTTIREAFVLGHPYPLAEFVDLSKAALERASARVTQKYGWGCGHALAQIREIETLADRYRGDAAAHVVVESYEP